MSRNDESHQHLVIKGISPISKVWLTFRLRIPSDPQIDDDDDCRREFIEGYLAIIRKFLPQSKNPFIAFGDLMALMFSDDEGERKHGIDAWVDFCDQAKNGRKSHTKVDAKSPNGPKFSTETPNTLRNT